MLVEINNSAIPQQQPSELGEDRLEDLLSEKLMEGFELDETPCPECSTPLVKMKRNPYGFDVKHLQAPVLIPNRNPGKPFEPMDDVPVCVSCNAHVVTNEHEVNILTTGRPNTEKRDPSPKSRDAPIIDLTTVPSDDEVNMTQLPYNVRYVATCSM